ncbi:MAG: TrkH family potassium uptake protein [Alphaproteobacteria bacterium]
MINFRPILLVIGSLLVPLGLGMLFPALVDFAVGDPHWQVFVTSSAFTLFIGLGLYLATRGASETLTIKQGFLLTSLVWVVLPAFAALPFIFSELQMSITDSYFEAMSGLTTTGSTVIVGLDSAPAGILMWRGLLQWLGGIGIIVMAIAIMPMLKVGGMQLFRMESSDASEKILPRMTQLAGAISGLYLVFTIACFAFYALAGMPSFDAAAHAMTTIATGGFSTSDQSLAKFNTPLVELTGIVFMIIGSLPFVLYLQVIRGRPQKLWQDSQVRFFLLMLLVLILSLALWLSFAQGFSFLSALRYASFNTVSILTGTGYAIAAYDTWGAVAPVFFFVIMFIGGCAGSTTCGIKVFRFQVLFAVVATHLKKISRPHAVYQANFNGRPISDRVVESVLGFLFLFAASYVALVVLLSLTGLDYITVLSGVSATLSNVGPGLGEVIGPSGTFEPLPNTAKWILSFAMLLGRLELLTILVLFTPGFWRA